MLLFLSYSTSESGLNEDVRRFVLMVKHEIIPCERCGTRIECKANSYTKCQCSVVQLTINEVQYISELYDGCLCAKCLFELQNEYREVLT